MVSDLGARKIRIDVVDDYENNVIPFWQKMGFISTGRNTLTWGKKTSEISIMEKGLI